MAAGEDRVPGYIQHSASAEPDVGRGENRAVYEGMVESVCEGMADALAELVDVERGMARVAELLRVSQPGRSGRLLVRFWRTGRKEVRLREPVLVRAVRVGRREVYERVDRRAKSRRDGSWGLNADRVDVALRAWWELVDRRAVLLRRLRGGVKSVGLGGVTGDGWRYAMVEVEEGIEESRRVVCGD